MRALILAVILAVSAPFPGLAQTDPVKKPAADPPHAGLGFGHGYFTGDTRPGLSATWQAGKNTSITAGAGPGAILDKSPPSVSGSAGITIRF